MEEIINMPVDKLYSKAVEWKQINDYNNYYIYMTMAANYDHPEAINCLTEDYCQDGNLLQDHIVTLPFYEQTNKFNYSSHYLAYMYKTGRGVKKDYQKAVELYTRAIEKGNSHSMNNLGVMYMDGDGVEKDYQKAIELYICAIEKGSSTSMNNLAVMYIDGDGVKKDYQKAIELYMCAIEKGSSISMNNLGYMYKTGDEVEQNYQKAIELYTLAIEKGNPFSMNNLAVMYRDGNGVEQNYQKAIELYTLAIEKEILASMSNLAMMYRDGYGVEQNYQKAIELYTRAIEKGCMYALENLTDLYRDHKSLFNKKDIIDFFLIKYPDNLKTIFYYDDDMISCLQQNHIMEVKIQELEKTNKELTDHINLSPGGPEYFEVMNEWKHKSQCDGL